MSTSLLKHILSGIHFYSFYSGNTWKVLWYYLFFQTKLKGAQHSRSISILIFENIDFLRFFQSTKKPLTKPQKLSCTAKIIKAISLLTRQICVSISIIHKFLSPWIQILFLSRILSRISLNTSCSCSTFKAFYMIITVYHCANLYLRKFF